MADTSSFESWMPSELNIMLPPVDGAKSAAAGESLGISCTAVYTYTPKNTAFEPPQKFEVCVPANTVPGNAGDATKIRLGELCIADMKGATVIFLDQKMNIHMSFEVAASSSMKSVCTKGLPRLVAVIVVNDKETDIREGDKRAWRVQKSGPVPLSSWKLEFRIQFQMDILHLRVNGLRSPTQDVNPALKLSLLQSGATTGDLNVLCKDGTKVPAHSAVLASVPYFAAKLKEDWSGAGWNLNNKLDLELPNPVNPDILNTFLEFVYGDLGALRQLDLLDASSMQDMFSLAEACGVLPLCLAVDHMAQVTSETAYLWLDWLSQEHGATTCALREKVKSVVSIKFTQPSFWKNLGVDELLALEEAVRTHNLEPLEAQLRCKLGFGAVLELGSNLPFLCQVWEVGVR